MQIDPERNAWMKTPALLSAMDALFSKGGEARFVGGAVRDSFLGRAVQDIDLAVDLPPDETAAILSAAGFKIVPTGIAHGTLTIVANGRGYEITSLRRDIITDGRHAKVSYTRDWREDALRRDFTMNALYVDARGLVYDYVGGLEDIAKRRLRFIGAPEDRICEDVLRILRYFRFLAELGKPFELDAPSLAACRKMAPSLPQLSGERVWKEMSRLLQASAAAPVLSLMRKEGILGHLMLENARIERFARLSRPLDAVSRLAALLHDEKQAVDLAARLRLSRKERERLARILAHLDRVRAVQTAFEIRRILYEAGAQVGHDALAICEGEDGADKSALFAEIAAWENPVFSLSGKDLAALGMPKGPPMGRLLARVEKWWIEKDFRPTREECLAKTSEMLSASDGNP